MERTAGPAGLRTAEYFDGLTVGGVWLYEDDVVHYVPTPAMTAEQQ